MPCLGLSMPGNSSRSAARHRRSGRDEKSGTGEGSHGVCEVSRRRRMLVRFVTRLLNSCHSIEMKPAMRRDSPRQQFDDPTQHRSSKPFVLITFCILGLTGLLAAQENPPVAARNKPHSSQLSATVVDTSGAVIAGAIVEVRGASGAAQRTVQSDGNGFFTISGLPAGDYRLGVSHPALKPKKSPSP